VLTGASPQTGQSPGVAGTALPKVSTIPGMPSWMVADLNSLEQQNQLSGVPPVILGLIALEESGLEKRGPGVNTSGYGGYFGLSTSSVPSSVLLTNSSASFMQQAPVAARIYATGLKLSGGNYIGAENYYQHGSIQGNRIIPNAGAALFAQFLGGDLKGSAGGTVGNASSATSSGCAFGVGPFCILSQAGLNRFYGALLMGAGGLVLTVGLGLVVIGALAETKLGRATSKTFGAAGLGAVAGAAAAPARAVSGRRQQRAASREQAATKQAATAHQQALRRAQLRTARARARRAEEGVRTQRAVTQGRTDSATIRDYERNEGAERRRQAVESRRAGRSVAAANRRRIAQRQKFEDVFGEAS
jgi:hypothetical protein